MPITRADALTGTTKQKEYFSDFLTNFDMTPFGNQIGRVTNEQAVNQSLKNLIKTSLGERPFQPMIGSDVYSMLFENQYPEDISLLELFIKNTIENNEPRANLLGVEVKIQPNENSLEISIYYNLINNPEPITLTVLLKRVR
jgi:phage baseplate assembly protein W